MVIVDGKITTAELLYDDAVAIRVLSHLSELVKHTADLNDTAANVWCCTWNRHLHHLTSEAMQDATLLSSTRRIVVTSSLLLLLLSFPCRRGATPLIAIYAYCGLVTILQPARRPAPSSPSMPFRACTVYLSKRQPQHPPGIPGFDPAPAD
jgi:hypothetical protein